MKPILSLALLALLTSCATKVVPLKGTYTNGNFEKVADKPKDQIWDNIIDFFAKNGIPIHIIDRSSGLIVSTQTELNWSREDKNGNLINKKAQIAIMRIKQGNGSIDYSQVTGQWNIRIKPVDQNKTLVNINIVNPKYELGAGRNAIAISREFKKGEFQSTGLFEETIYNIISQ